MTDDGFEKYEQVWTAVHDLVDSLLKNVDTDDADEIRDRLTNEFRFWKRNDRLHPNSDS